MAQDRRDKPRSGQVDLSKRVAAQQSSYAPRQTSGQR